VTSAEAEFARTWLAERGVTSNDSGRWTGPDPSGGQVETASDVAHKWTGEALADPALDALGRLRLGLGLLDLLGEYWVSCEIRWAVRDTPDERVARTFWNAYRQRLEVAEPADPISYSLWVDWFEDRSTVARAFTELLANDVDQLAAEGRLEELAHGPLFWRAEHILRISGPVPWPVKSGVYETVAAVPELQPALYQGILRSYHDYFGDLEPQAALALLRKLKLPADTTSLAPLCTVLAAGGVNHYRDPEAWKAAIASGA
jgi:hypothetical protein